MQFVFKVVLICFKIKIFPQEEAIGDGENGEGSS